MALLISHQDFDTPLCLAQSFLTFARQANALFKEFETFFEGQIAAFKFGHDLFQRFQRAFETPGWGSLSFISFFISGLIGPTNLSLSH